MIAYTSKTQVTINDTNRLPESRVNDEILVQLRMSQLCQMLKNSPQIFIILLNQGIESFCLSLY